MAQALLIPSTGSISVGGFTATMVADFATQEITSTQTTENCTHYGGTVMSTNVGNGTPDMAVNVGAWALNGANNTAPGLAGVTYLSALGANCTFSFATNCTETGIFIVDSIKLSAGRLKAAVAVAIGLKNAGDITEAWQVT